MRLAEASLLDALMMNQLSSSPNFEAKFLLYFSSHFCWLFPSLNNASNSELGDIWAKKNQKMGVFAAKELAFCSADFAGEYLPLIARFN
jgi:hypothetical protein